MKNSTTRTITALILSTVLLYSCTKSVSVNNPENLPTTTNGSFSELHNYGLIPMQPEQWSNVPTFSKSVLSGNVNVYGLSTTTTLPGSYLLASPAVRDQGQIGSCTGFCGAETDEILYYYNSGSYASPSTGFSTQNGMLVATGTQVANSSLLSPLFVYYVERCVILKQSITSDRGAYMVNIPETLQGLTNNKGTGTALTLNGTFFDGDCYENLYPYPSNGSNTSTQYTTAPSGTAISNAPNFSITLQNGTTGSSGSTTHGYFVINSTDPVGDVKTAIFFNKPVMMGFNVYDNSRYQYFEGLNTTKYTYNPLTTSGKLAQGVRLLGGHAVPIIGYINDASQPGGGLFICENSWSTSWGYKGYFYLPYSVLKSTTIVPAGSLYVTII